jgi:hypothetical protein
LTRAPKPKPAEMDLTPITVALAELIPNPRNPRHHSDDQLARIGASLKKEGQTKPLLARKANRMMIAGHGVLEAANRIGWKEIRVLLLDVDQGAADRMMLGDNRLADLATTDHERVAELLREVSDVDWFGIGFNQEEAEKAMGQGGDDLEVKEIDTAAVADEFWVTVRGPLALQAKALARLKTLLAEFPTVAVELGTIAGD